MTNAHQSDAPAPPRKPVGVVMIAVGALMLVGGVAGGYAAFVAAVTAPFGTSGPMATLPLSVHSGYKFPQHVSGPEFTGYWIGATVAALGAIVLVAGIVLEVTQRRARRGAPRWSRSARLLLGSGVAIVAIGVIGGAIDRWSASRRLLTSGASPTINAQLELTFPAPDYTVFWIFMVVAALGVIAVVAGIRRARTQHRTSDSAA